MKQTVWTRAIAVSFVPVALSLSLACSATSGPDTVATDAGPDQAQDTGTVVQCAARPDLPEAAPACTTLANTARAIPFTPNTGNAPTPAGGPILDGVYEATRAEAYGTNTGNGRRITFAIDRGATRMFWAGEVLDAAGATVVASFAADTAISVNGTRINFTVSCVSTQPSPIPAALDFTVSGQNLVLSLVNGATVAATTYTRRGCTP